MTAKIGVDLFIPSPALCTDNAAMAGIAFPKLVAGHVADLDLDVSAGLVRPSRRN
jgi:N6-L-threonylcarbamoyladenine synthase